MQDIKLSGQPIFCQLLSYLPKELVKESVNKFDSDKYYKTMSCYKQFVFMFYGIISQCRSLRCLCKNLLFLEGKLTYLGIKDLPAVSTLSDANMQRKSEVFEHLYYLLLEYYKPELSKGFVCLPINDEAGCDKIKRFDATTFTLFSDIFKGAGRNPESGKKRGGIKAQTVLAYDGLVPEYISLGESAKNDKDFLGQLQVKEGYTYVFDKGYVNYKVYQQWGIDGVFFVTRLNENASYKVVEEKVLNTLDIASGQGVLNDQLIELTIKDQETKLKLRLVTYRSPTSGHILRFLTNNFLYKAETIALIYRNRWAIEPFFKQLKQNYQLAYFFSDSKEGIKSQIWIALIANLIFTLIYTKIKQAEQFVTIISMAKNNLGSYICFLTILKPRKLDADKRNNGKMQLDLFEIIKGGVFEMINKST